MQFAFIFVATAACVTACLIHLHQAVLETIHIIVADNNNYENAQYVPLDKHHRHVDTATLSPEEKKRFKYTLCYKMVNLLHLSKSKNYFIFFGTKIAGGKTHDKTLGRELVDNFVANVGKGKIKTLIFDRGFFWIRS